MFIVSGACSSLGFRVQVLGFRVLGFRVQGKGRQRASPRALRIPTRPGSQDILKHTAAVESDFEHPRKEKKKKKKNLKNGKHFSKKKQKGKHRKKR